MRRLKMKWIDRLKGLIRKSTTSVSMVVNKDSLKTNYNTVSNAVVPNSKNEIEEHVEKSAQHVAQTMGAALTKASSKTLNLLLVRKALEDTYTIGFLYVNDGGNAVYLCDVLEDKVRDINKSGRFEGTEKKVYGETAIPYGKYEIDMKTVSPAMQNKPWGKKYNGVVPRLKNVPHFSGILIHPGNTTKDTNGCLLVGDNRSAGTVVNSQATYYKLMDKYLIPAREAGRKIYIEIV